MRGLRSSLLALLVLVAAAAGAVAQSTDLNTLARELERLRKDMVDLQRYVYAGEGEPLAVVPSDTGGGDAAQLQLRVQQLEERLRLLTGQIEELQHQQRQTDQRLEELVASAGTAGAASAGGTAGEIPAGGEGTLTDEDLAAGAEGGDAAVAGSGPVLPAGSEMDQYNFAFSLLRKADYDGAQAAFNEFIALHPGSELAGNAYYWLGETYYVRNAYQEAAVSFLKGYQQFPQGDKAPDNLLKLGMTLTRLGKNAEACATFNELNAKFPDAPQTVRDRAAQEAAAAGCG